MRYFVNIETLYSENSNRTIPALSRVYDNELLLEEKIRLVFKDGLARKDIEGKKVLLKPNWVKHSSIDSDELCMRTHDNFLMAALKIILDMKPYNIMIGDAPIQGCNWENMLSPEFYDAINKLKRKYSIPITIKDFRRVTFDPSKNNPKLERNPITDYLIFDVGKESYLEPISLKDKQLFRVTNYNPDRLGEAHAPGVHKYCITKELFDADVVISLPKVKTHQKAGITAALKNIVGLNGDKDYLPHHRLGGTGFGGDCYPGKNYLRYWSELLLDFANRRQGKVSYWLGYKLASLLWRFSFPGRRYTIEAGWSGNDTTWRMVLDLNKIVIYGKSDGSISDMPQRQLFSLCDGIVGGQGNGPLNPEPLPLGIISFTNHSGMNDTVMAMLMGFDPQKISMLKNATTLLNKNKIDLFLGGSKVKLSSFNKFAIKATPPPGWVKNFT